MSSLLRLRRRRSVQGDCSEASDPRAVSPCLLYSLPVSTPVSTLFRSVSALPSLRSPAPAALPSFPFLSPSPRLRSLDSLPPAWSARSAWSFFFHTSSSFFSSLLPRRAPPVLAVASPGKPRAPRPPPPRERSEATRGRRMRILHAIFRSYF